MCIYLGNSEDTKRSSSFSGETVIMGLCVEVHNFTCMMHQPWDIDRWISRILGNSNSNQIARVCYGRKP